jgi:hypothetical protein
MIFDQDVKRLVPEVADGDMTALAALMDRLKEIGDTRWSLLGELASDLMKSAQKIKEKDQNKRWVARSPEELAYRRSNQCIMSWGNFIAPFTRLFWGELSGQDDSASALVEVEKVLDTPLQAVRFTQAQEQEDQEDQETVDKMPRGYSENLGASVNQIRNMRGRRSFSITEEENG